MNGREVMKLALEALEVATTPLARDRQKVLAAVTALRAALVAAEKEEQMTRDEQEQALLIADELALLAHRSNSDFYIKIDDQDVLLISRSSAELRRLHELHELYQDKARRLQAENGRLREEVRVLRLYGNKDCTAMADEALKQETPR